MGRDAAHLVITYDVLALSSNRGIDGGIDRVLQV